MTGTMQVKKLTKSGMLISEIDYDSSFRSEDNPQGFFVMIIEPFIGSKKNFIFYQKIDGGFLVEGEGYIITGTENEIKEKIKGRKKEYKPKAFDYIEKELRSSDDKSRNHD